jgi:hypothetical protein
MQRLVIRLIIALPAFVLGVSTHAVWEKREHIIDVCTELMLNYQD